MGSPTLPTRQLRTSYRNVLAVDRTLTIHANAMRLYAFPYVQVLRAYPKRGLTLSGEAAKNVVKRCVSKGSDPFSDRLLVQKECV